MTTELIEHYNLGTENSFEERRKRFIAYLVSLGIRNGFSALSLVAVAARDRQSLAANHANLSSDDFCRAAEIPKRRRVGIVDLIAATDEEIGKMAIGLGVKRREALTLLVPLAIILHSEKVIIFRQLWDLLTTEERSAKFGNDIDAAIEIAINMLTSRQSRVDDQTIDAIFTSTSVKRPIINFP